MDVIGSSTLSLNMVYTTAQSMCYLVASSRGVQQLNDLERSHSDLVASEVELKCQVLELEKAARGFNEKYDLLATEKAYVEDVRSSVEACVDF